MQINQSTATKYTIRDRRIKSHKKPKWYVVPYGINGEDFTELRAHELACSIWDKWRGFHRTEGS